MQDEIVDIVNEQDNVIGTASKQEAHANGLLHRTVIAEVIDSKGNWLFVKQAANKQDAGKLVSPVGGHVRAGESCEDAIKREALEELGLTDSTYSFKGKLIFNRDVLGHKENHYFIVYEIYSDEEPTLNHESVSSQKLSIDELKLALAATPERFGDAFFPIVHTLYPELLSLQ